MLWDQGLLRLHMRMLLRMSSIALTNVASVNTGSRNVATVSTSSTRNVLNGGPKVSSHGPTVVKNAAYKASNPDKRAKSSANTLGTFEVVPVNPDQEVVELFDPTPIDLPSIEEEVVAVPHVVAKRGGSHTAVSLVEAQLRDNQALRGKIMRARGSAGRALNDSPRRGLNLQKPAGVRISSQPILTEWMSGCAKQLDEVGAMRGDLNQDVSFQSEDPVVAITDNNVLEGSDGSGTRDDLIH
ncbi:hypothetical protein V6N12_047453 [Hibiscus sabdariffa]|uniref:Uncharacterized protein n=1 Tax=Hibiscus sabdariffa TaxID=183260 RepID=A0ABR2DAX2_9ROSI